MLSSFVYTYHTVINAPIEEVWSFFETATNLSKITTFPKVVIISDPRTVDGNEIVMKLLIERLSFKWISIIQEVKNPYYFVDVGTKLPYPLIEWKHTHTFLAQKKQTLMKDTVVIRSLILSWLMKPFLRLMFSGREKALHHHFS
jgi:ligand-binding SRPBCC domain-containing protein